jgi:GTP-binding protein HflX
VRDVLAEIGGLEAPELIVANKADVAPEAARCVVADHEGAVAISAATGEGIDALLVAVSDRLRSLVDPVELHIPYSRGDLIAALHRSGEVLTETATEDGLVMRARVEAADLGRFDGFVVDGA